MGFPRFGVSFESETARECTQMQVNHVRHAWYVFSYCMPENTGAINGCYQFLSQQVIGRSIVCGISYEMAIGELKMSLKVRQPYGKSCCGMLTPDLVI